MTPGWLSPRLPSEVFRSERCTPCSVQQSFVFLLGCSRSIARFHKHCLHRGSSARSSSGVSSPVSLHWSRRRGWSFQFTPCGSAVIQRTTWSSNAAARRAPSTSSLGIAICSSSHRQSCRNLECGVSSSYHHEHMLTRVLGLNREGAERTSRLAGSGAKAVALPIDLGGLRMSDSRCDTCVRHRVQRRRRERPRRPSLV